MDTVPSATSVRFLSTPSARRATDADGDTLTVTEFLSTPSARRATRAAAPCRFPSPYFYPRPPRGGRPRPERGSRQRQRISIHALREEGDGRTSRRRSKPANFYPRPPRGGRLDRQSVAAQILGFLSTPSARRATHSSTVRLSGGAFLSTPSSRRATLGRTVTKVKRRDFYPRPPHGGRRHSDQGEQGSRHNFYPRPPRGGRPMHLPRGRGCL